MNTNFKPLPIPVQFVFQNRQLGTHEMSILPRIGDTIKLTSNRYETFVVSNVTHYIGNNHDVKIELSEPKDES
jgi:hypothetical protein